MNVRIISVGLLIGSGLAFSQTGGAEACSGSPICAWGKGRNLISHEVRQPDLGYAYAYPFALPEGTAGGVSAVAVNSKDHLFAFQRNAAGRPQLFEFDQNRKLVRTIGEEVIGHQQKAHGMAIDAEDNIWICDENGDTVTKLNPEGKVLMTLGVPGQRGDWDEARGQKLLWQPLHVAFGASGDFYIGMGHANESPNDTDRSATNRRGAARVLHLDKDGRYIGQWFGNNAGQGHFSMVHGLAVNPDNGNVYIGDREEYRIVVYTAEGKFVKTIQMRNLVCGLYADPHKQLWMATGQDGQIFKIDWDGNVLGATGNGPGKGEGQFTESNYMAMDSQGNLYTGDTSYGRITEMVAPAAAEPLPATDVTSADIQAFINSLPPGVVSDKPIRILDVGGYHVGVYGVLRPASVRQEANLHQTRVTEIYYILEGKATLVTGGTLPDPKPMRTGSTTWQSGRIEGGVTRKVAKGDVIVIPGRTPHWFSSQEGNLRYLIFRADPDGSLPLR